MTQRVCFVSFNIAILTEKKPAVFLQQAFFRLISMSYFFRLCFLSCDVTPSSSHLYYLVSSFLITVQIKSYLHVQYGYFLLRWKPPV